MVAFYIGTFPIHRYGIFYLIAFILWYLFIKYVAKTKLFADRPKLQNLLEKGSEDIIIYAMLWVIIGGRLGQVLIYDLQYYLAHPWEIIAVRKWWMSFVGGMVWVLISFLILRKRRQLSWKDFFLLFDCLVVIVPLWIMLGRIGNFLNQELYGIIVADWARWIGEWLKSLLSSLHIFHVYPLVDEALRINTNFLASFFEGFVSLVIGVSIFYKRLKTKKYNAGYIVWVFLTYYSVIRFWLEFLRMDSQSEFVWPFTKSQWLFIAFFILGRSILLYKKIIKRIVSQQNPTK